MRIVLAVEGVGFAYVYIIDQTQGQDGWILALVFYTPVNRSHEICLSTPLFPITLSFIPRSHAFSIPPTTSSRYHITDNYTNTKLASFFFCVFMDRDEVHKNGKRERGQYPAILTELAWSIKDLLYGIKSTEKIILVLVYFRALKRKPVSYVQK